LREALRIRRRAELISFTHWDIWTLRDQPMDELSEIEEYINLKRHLENEHQRHETQKHRFGVTGRG